MDRSKFKNMIVYFNSIVFISPSNKFMIHIHNKTSIVFRPICSRQSSTATLTRS